MTGGKLVEIRQVPGGEKRPRKMVWLQIFIYKNMIHLFVSHSKNNLNDCFCLKNFLKVVLNRKVFFLFIWFSGISYSLVC